MVTTLSLTAFLALITLAPLVLGALIFVLGAFQRATWRIVLVLGIVGALIPAVGLLYFIPAVAFGQPLAIQPFGLGSGFSAWIAPTYRLDAFALYTAIGVALLVVPLLLWMAFADRADVAALAEAGAETAGSDFEDDSQIADDAGAIDADDVATDGEEDQDEPSAAPATGVARVWEIAGGAQGLATPTLVRSVAFALALEMLALTAALADSVVLLGVSWALLALVAWAVGEAASDRDHLDWLGLGLMVAGPILWLIVVLFPASGAHTPRLYSLSGANAFNTFQCILLAIAIALAGGAYPFTAWVRRRAALATPAGVAAMVVGLVPAALYVALRTYEAAVNTTNQWPLFVNTPGAPATPAPVNAGIAFVVLGTATIVISGMLALGQRDARPLVGLVGAAQLGWGLVGVGIGLPASVMGTVVLLPAIVLGLGSILAAFVASGIITSDLEPDADGPRTVGAPVRPVLLAAWAVGALSVVGVPLLAGFAPRHLMDVGAIQISGLGIPLLGLCWMGDVLLALALLRAASPALGAPAGEPLANAFTYDPRDIPAALLAVLALAVGIFPALLTGVFGSAASAAVLGPTAVKGLATSSALGYTTGSAQWLGAIAWLVVVVVAVVVMIARMSVTSTASAALAAGHGAGASTIETDDEVDDAEAREDAEEPLTLPAEPDRDEATLTPDGGAVPPVTLAAPADAWSDLKSTLESPWLLPAGGWLLSGTDGGADENEAEDGVPVAVLADAESDEAGSDEAGDESAVAAAEDRGAAQEPRVPVKKAKRGEPPRDAQ